MIQVKITTVGNSLGIVLPKDVLNALGVERGDFLQLESDDQGVRIVKVDDAYNRAVAAGRECFDRYPETLAALAR